MESDNSAEFGTEALRKELGIDSEQRPLPARKNKVVSAGIQALTFYRKFET